MKKMICLLLVTLFAGNLAGQGMDAITGKRYIEVTGTSETEVVPDEIYLTITLLERMESKEKVTIEKQESDLKQNVKELGIDLSNLSLNSADADYRKIRTFKKDVMISKSYLLKVSSAEMLSKVYERLDKINAHDAYISRFTHSRILEMQKENRIKALKAAKEKVEYLLAAIGQQAGQPLQITETTNFVQETPQGGAPAMYRNAVQSYGNDRFLEESAQEISFKKIKIRNAYLVKYEILGK